MDQSNESVMMVCGIGVRQLIKADGRMTYTVDVWGDNTPLSTQIGLLELAKARLIEEASRK